MTDIYDLFYPSPPTLKELASIEIALDLWRQEIIERRINNTLKTLDLRSNTLLSSLIPISPSPILVLVESYVQKVGLSIDYWLQYQFGRRECGLDVLNNFLDFVCDFDGTIDFDKTGQRMILSDGISDDMKFHIACFYCFEEDISRLWPEVKPRISTNRMKFATIPQNVFWICYLKNEFIEIPYFNSDENGVADVMKTVVQSLSFSSKCNWSALRYFLNRLDFEIWIDIVKSSLKGFGLFEKIISRYVLSKLNEIQMEEFLNTKADTLLSGLPYEETNGMMATWTFIKDKITQECFASLIWKIFKKEANCTSLAEDVESCWCEIWTNAPVHLKQSFGQGDLLKTPQNHFIRNKNYGSRRISFLLAVLSDVSTSIRHTFWLYYWRAFIFGTKTKDLQRLMDLCFENKKEMLEFRKTTFSMLLNSRNQCSKLLKDGQVSELSEFLKFCCPKEQTFLKTCRTLLNDDIVVSSELLANARSFSEFIDEAHYDATEYKDKILQNVGFNVNLRSLMEFVDTFASSEEVVLRWKKKLHFSIKRALINDSYRQRCDDDFTIFMKWWLQNDEEITRFKQNCNIDSLIQSVIPLMGSEGNRVYREEDENDHDIFGNPVKTPLLPNDSLLAKFLRWYFVTPEALTEFKRKYADDDVFVKWIGL